MEGISLSSIETVVKPSIVWRTALRVLGAVAAVVILALFAAHFVWKYSGSNQWKLVMDRNDIKVYSIKTPGSSQMHFKGTTRIRATLDSVVMAMMAHDVKHCAQWFPSCSMEETLVPFNATDRSDVTFYRLGLPRPFSPREFLLRTEVSQDFTTKAVTVTFTAEPDRMPRNACCVRIEEMQNSWKFTPLGNGELAVEFTEHMNQRLPYFLVNRNMARGVYHTLHFLPTFFAEPEWKDARSLTSWGINTQG